MDTRVLPFRTEITPRALNPCSPWARPSHHTVRCIQGCTRRPDLLSFTKPQTRLTPVVPSVTGRDPQGIVRAQSLRTDSSCDCKPVSDLEGTMLHEISQTEKDEHCTGSLIHRILKKKKQNKSQTHRNRGLVAAGARERRASRRHQQLGGAPDKDTPLAPFFLTSISSLNCEKCVAVWKSDSMRRMELKSALLLGQQYGSRAQTFPSEKGLLAGFCSMFLSDQIRQESELGFENSLLKKF